jgi:hypothetical protein
MSEIDETTNPIQVNCEYLGDAVYTSRIDGNTLALTTSHHLISNALQVIYLEPEVIVKLIEYLKVHYKGAF